MTDRINLDSYVSDIIAQASSGMTTLDLDALRDDALETVHDYADNAVTYYHHAQTIIDDYERETGEPEDLGQTFTASEWQEAMTAYAYGVASAYLSGKVEEAVTQVEEAASALIDHLASRHDESFDADHLRVSRECPHGWASHDYEADAADSSIMVWKSGQLDGGNGAAIQAGGIWLSVTWGG